MDAPFFSAAGWLHLAKFPLAIVKDHFDVRDGDHNRLPDEEVVLDPAQGVRYLRAQDLRDGVITADDPVYVRRRYYDTVSRSHIRPGYLLFSIMGSVGNQAIVPDGFPDATANRAVGILIPKASDPVLTRYLFLLFLTDLGAQLYERVKRGGLQRRTNLADLEALQFPLAPGPDRSRLVAALDAAREERHRKLGQAEYLLRSLDDFVLDALGLSPPAAQDRRTTYAIRLRDVRAAKKLCPDHFHPERLAATRLISRKYKGDQSATLHSIAEFRRDQRQLQSGDHYVGLANVQSNTGELIQGAEGPVKGTVFEYRSDDVLFARLRPYLNKVYRAETPGVCSPEFHVLRVREDKRGNRRVLPDYLAAVMRSRIVLAQTRHMMTGNTHPRLANEDVGNLVVPIPPPKVQTEIATEALSRRETARHLRQEAASIWDKAKAAFEAILLEHD